MNVSATLSPHQVEAVKLTVDVHGKRVARLEFLRGRCRWPAFWSDEDWNTWCLLLLCGPIEPVAPVIVVPPVVVLVATLVVLNNVFNATLGYVYTPLSTSRFLRHVVPCICFLFSSFFILGIQVRGPRRTT